MRKEFEENEKNLSEKNLDLQDDIDDETFQKILEEEFIEREKQIEEALFADEDSENLVFTDQEVKDSYQELLRRFAKEQKEKSEIAEELVPDEKLVRRVVAEQKNASVDRNENAEISENADAHTEEKKVLPMEEVRERRKKSSENRGDEESDSKITEIRRKNAGNRWQRLGKVVGMAVVAVACVFAASMTSEANRKYLVNSVRIWSGDDTKTVNYNNESNENANPDEDRAIADIEEKLRIKMPIFYYRPYNLEFSNYVVDTLTDLARIEYKYNGSNILLIIDKENSRTASKISSLDGSEGEQIVLDNEGIQIQIKKISDNDNYNYSAEWHKDGTVYLLFGKIELGEIKKIVENMKF